MSILLLNYYNVTIPLNELMLDDCCPISPGFVFWIILIIICLAVSVQDWPRGCFYVFQIFAIEARATCGVAVVTHSSEKWGGR